MADFLQNPWTWLGGVALTVLAIYFRDTIVGVFKYVLPSPDNLVHGFRRFFGQGPLDTHFTILICDLDGDEETRFQTRHVVAAFRGQ